MKAANLELLKSHFKDAKQFHSITPPFSFEPDATYLCGKHPEESNSGTKFCLAEKANDCELFRLMKMLPTRPRIIRKSVNQVITKIDPAFLRKYDSNYGCIPFRLLKYFELSQEHNLFQRNSGSYFQSIFDMIDEDYFYIGAPFTSGFLKFIKNELTNDIYMNHNLFFIYISDLDYIGHKHGGNSKQYKSAFNEIIQFIKYLLSKSSSKENVSYLIFGDHGMVDVEKSVHIESIIKDLPLVLEKDFLYFLDSTLARFWFFNDNAQKVIEDTLTKLCGGEWITEEEIGKYRIAYDHNRFGDKIWWTNENTIISPNFWQGELRLKGMHGYRNEVIENHTCMISNFDTKNKNMDSIDMIELHHIIKEFLDIA